MAPNLQRTQFILQSFDFDLEPVNTGFPALTSEVSQQLQKVSIQTTTQDTSSYWEWLSQNGSEINKIVAEESLSADHIVANIQRQPATPAVSTLAFNDQHWDWSHAKTESVDHWNWPASNDAQAEKSIDSELYWAW